MRSSEKNEPNSCVPILNSLLTISNRFALSRCRLKMNPEALSLIAAASAIRDGSLSPVEYVSALFARIDAAEAEVHAWVTMDREAGLGEGRKTEMGEREKKILV